MIGCGARRLLDGCWTAAGRWSGAGVSVGVLGLSGEVEYRLLGPFQVVRGDSVVAVGRRQVRALLAILALRVNAAVTTDELVELLWPGDAPGRPQTAIHGYVSALRKLLGREAVETAGGGYILRAEGEQVDVRRYEQRVADAQGLLTRGDALTGLQLLRDAGALWRGPPLSDFSYDGWAQPEIRRLEELRLVEREMQLEA